MNSALMIALMAVGISLMAVLIAVNAAKATRDPTKGDGGAGFTADGGGADCGGEGGRRL